MTEQSNINQLSAQDAQFLYIQSATNLTHVMAVYIYDPSTAPGGKVRFKDIIEHMRKRMDVSPMFKRKLYLLTGSKTSISTSRRIFHTAVCRNRATGGNSASMSHVITANHWI